MSTTDERPDGKRFGKYELLDRLGRGGMADVWRARIAGPQGFARTLVLKRILPHLTADERARQLFEREARVVSRLSHANVVKVFEFGEIEGEYYLAMEYVEGHDLAALIRAGGASPGLAALVLREVCRGLAYAHALRDDAGVPLRILHRDISPSNVMIGHDGAVRLLDFGIAKSFADPRDKRTVKGTIRGKFGYMAPEVIDGVEPDARADLFSVGVVLHEVLSGKRLFRGGSDLETLALVKRASIPPPSSLNPATPPALDAICMRALKRDRDQRFASGDEMAAALDQIAHDLRFGPSQLTEVMARCFGPPGETAWVPHEDSGPNTIREVELTSSGLGTARSVELARAEEALSPTHEERTERERRDTIAARPSARDAQVPVDDLEAPTMPRPASKARAKAPSGAWYIVAGALFGVVVVVAVMQMRPGAHRPRSVPAVPPSVAVATDMAVLDAATRAAREPDPTRLIFPPEVAAPDAAAAR